jgi:hypothetical protein
MNNLTISHADLAKVQEFADAYNGGKTCQRFIPRPESVNNKDAFAEDGWYTWNVNHWGTKWDFGKDEYTDPAKIEDGKVVVSFNTAWSPPIQFYKKLVELDYNVRGTYFEPGMSFCGIWDNGVDNYIDYGDMNQEDIIPVALWNEFGMDDFFEMMEEDA